MLLHSPGVTTPSRGYSPSLGYYTLLAVLNPPGGTTPSLVYNSDDPGGQVASHFDTIAAVSFMKSVQNRLAAYITTLSDNILANIFTHDINQIRVIQ